MKNLNLLSNLKHDLPASVVVFFVALIFFVVKADKNYINHMQQIPFDKEQ